MGLLCDECNKNIATVFLTKMSGNEVSRVQLCEECARKMEETTEAANLLAFIPQILSGLQGVEEDLVDDVLSNEVISCEACGTSFNDFQKMGFLGCSECYRAFGEPLRRVIVDFQGSGEHVGKMPAKLSRTAMLKKKMLELEERLRSQIEEEEYEAAAMVRDQIKEIEDTLDMEGRDGDGQ